jgi:hypothetical protein
MTTPRRRSQPHRFQWPLNAQQLQDIDDTFQILFDEMKRIDEEQDDPTFIPAHATTHGSSGSDPVTIAESQVVGLTADLASKVPNTRQIISGAGLTGGGDLSADRTLAVGAGTNIASNADDVAVTPQPGAASRLLGRGSASSGAWEVISLGSGISMSGTTLSASGTGIEVKEVDGAPDVVNVSIVRVSNGTLTDNGGGQVTIDTTGSSTGYDYCQLQSFVV